MFMKDNKCYFKFLEKPEMSWAKFLNFLPILNVQVAPNQENVSWKARKQPKKASMAVRGEKKKDTKLNSKKATENRETNEGNNEPGKTK